jgi:hypothetical protein
MSFVWSLHAPKNSKPLSLSSSRPPHKMDAMLQMDWLVSSLLPYIGGFGDLRSFAVANKANLAAVRSLTGTWPGEIRELLTTWCTETPVPIYFARARLTQSRLRARGVSRLTSQGETPSHTDSRRSCEVWQTWFSSSPCRLLWLLWLSRQIKMRGGERWALRGGGL